MNILRVLANRVLFPKLVLTFALLLSGAAAAGCQAPPVTTEPTPLPSPTPTLNFSDLPPVIAAEPIDQTATPVPIVTSTPLPSDTPSPDPPQPLQLLPATPDTSWEACPGAPPSHLRIGDRAAISYDPYLPTRVRTRPNPHTSSVLGLIIPGEVVEIMDGPACTDNAVWWKVTSLRKDLEGWVQEGDEVASWLIRTDTDSAVRVPPPTSAPCPVADEGLCTFVESLQASVVVGDFVEILDNTRTVDCPDQAKDQRCAQWGVLGSGLGGLDLTPLALIEPGWLTYAPPPRAITGLLLPPYEDLDTTLPDVPALFILTRDPLWDWLFFIDEIEGEWQIQALMMISRDSEAYPTLTDSQVSWP